MIRRQHLVGGLAAATVAAVSIVVHESMTATQPNVLRAQAYDPFQDSDGDMLPDTLEWVTMSDPASNDTDHDGRDDFLEAVQSTSMNAATPALPIDQEMRVLLSCLPDKVTNENYVWMHCLFRFASGNLDLDWFMPFLATNTGVAVPISELFGRTPMRITVRQHPGEGAYAVATLRLARERDLMRTLPCTINARASISGRYITSSMYVFDSHGVLSGLVPLGKDAARGVLLVQSLVPHDGSGNTFFSGNRICAQTLVITGQVPGGYLCEIDSSSCQPANGLRCASDCPAMVGRVLLAPDGPGAITGG